MTLACRSRVSSGQHIGQLSTGGPSEDCMTYLQFADQITSDDLLGAELYLEMLIVRDKRQTRSRRGGLAAASAPVRSVGRTAARVFGNVQPRWMVQDLPRRHRASRHGHIDSRSL